MKVKNWGIFTALIIYIVLFCLDLYSTLRLKHLVQYLESNPIYPYVGIPGIIVVNLLLAYSLYWLYSRSKNTNYRFIVMNMFITLLALRIMVIHGNFQIAANPPPLELAMQVTTEMKRAAVYTISKMAFLPFFIAIITHYFYSYDHKIEVKNA